jgi:hypothetical protein
MAGDYGAVAADQHRLERIAATRQLLRLRQRQSELL